MITVACVLRSGGDFTPEYVSRLQAGVAANLQEPHRFVCLSDVDVPCERIPLITTWPGWLSKIELFRPGLFEAGALYFDLDTVILGDVTPLVAFDHRFTMLSDFQKPVRPASGVMAWSGDYSRIFSEFSDDLVAEYKDFAPNFGDCGWIVSRLGHEPERFQNVLPGLIGSYKEWLPSKAAVCCFHGRPRPADVGWSAAGAWNRRALRVA